MTNLEKLNLKQEQLRERCRQTEKEISSRVEYFGKNYPSILLHHIFPEAGIMGLVGKMAEYGLNYISGHKNEWQEIAVKKIYTWLSEKFSRWTAKDGSKGSDEEENVE